MKEFFRFVYLFFYWIWKFFSSGLSVLINLMVLGSILLFIGLLSYNPVIDVPDKAALMLTLEGDVVEQRSTLDPFALLVGRVSGLPVEKKIFLQDLLDVIQAAAKDQRIRVLVLDSTRLGSIGLDQVQTIGKALDEFRQNGKKVIARGDNYNQAQYALALHSDAIYLHPMGAVKLRGLALSQLYLQSMLEKLEINVHVFRVGTFKSAVEPLIRNDMSPEVKEAHKRWLGKIWQAYCEDVAKYRKMPLKKVMDSVDLQPERLERSGGDHGRLALQARLVDGLKVHEEVEQLIGQAADPKAKEGAKYASISYGDYLRTISPSYQRKQQGPNRIAIISASGTIVYGKGGEGQIGATPLIAQIRKAWQNQEVKALVLRINTGGGSAFASELIRQELLQAKLKGKIVVVSMASVAASGGYWLAAPADLIVASPMTLTGSIGIFGVVPTLEDTLDSIGVHSDGVGTTRIAQFGNLATAMDDNEKKMMQLSVEQGYSQFLDIVMRGRNMEREAVEKVAEGRIWDGASAMQLGLVDRMGNLQTAVAAAAELAKVPADSAFWVEGESKGLLALMWEGKQGLAGWRDMPGEALAGAMLMQYGRSAFAPLLLLLESRDPMGLHAHSLLPPTGLLLR